MSPRVFSRTKIAIIMLCILCCIFLLLATCKTSNPAVDSGFKEIKIPEKEDGITMLAGTNEGLFTVSSAGRLSPLWTGGSVKKILLPQTSGDPWTILGSEGVLISNDLENWELRNQGLPIKTIKVFENGKKSFLQIVQDLKDLKINPADPQIMVTATKDRVYLSRNRGQSWTGLRLLQYRTNGIKTAASAFMPNSSSGAAGGSDLTVFLSHSVYGIHYIQPDKPNAQWIELVDGLEKLETTDNPDEVADIAVVLAPVADGTATPEIFVSQTFRRRIYRLDWNKKAFNLVWSDDSPFGTVDSLSVGEDSLYFLHEGMIASINFSNLSMQKQPEIVSSIRKIKTQTKTNTVVQLDKNIALHELWLLDEHEQGQSAPQVAHITADKEGLYMQPNHAMDKNRLNSYYNTMQRAGLNMVVIDMKDDYGRLRFTPNNPAISAKGRVFRPLDIDVLLRDMKERGIFTVARIVVFKDQELASKEGGKYAVWDSRNSKPWVGYEDRRRKKTEITDADRNDRLNQILPADDPEYEIVRRFYDEYWVDPYSEEVWEYVALISEELHERGFDEIQFDYIRFPTDGQNLGNARYRWQDSGMDMESAILSFLSHVRKRISAPISIDIYGSNGWYRTGARTGQEVELFAPWVDVICPMYYPSHFEQYFLAQHPPELRPWRIYYYGTLRTSRITRGQVVVRPWTQAFYLNVSYDRLYYDTDYVLRQIEGVREAGNGGFTHWNNSGRYDDLPDR